MEKALGTVPRTRASLARDCEGPSPALHTKRTRIEVRCLSQGAILRRSARALGDINVTCHRG